MTAYLTHFANSTVDTVQLKTEGRRDDLNFNKERVQTEPALQNAATDFLFA
jgi:hypothetical protein